MRGPAELVDAYGCEALAFAGDATHANTAERAIGEATAAFGGFHGLYHVAGGSGRKHGDGPLHELTDEGWDYTLKLNLSSLLYSNRAAVQQFLKQGTGGSVLNMGSVLGCSPSPHHFATHAYAAAKGALTSLMTTMAAAYLPDRIRVNVVAPGLTETPMARRAAADPAIRAYAARKQPLAGELMDPDEIAHAAVFFLSDESRTITGQLLKVDGGWSVASVSPEPDRANP